MGRAVDKLDATPAVMRLGALSAASRAPSGRREKAADLRPLHPGPFGPAPGAAVDDIGWRRRPLRLPWSPSASSWKTAHTPQGVVWDCGARFL